MAQQIIADLMARDPISCPPDAPIRTAAELMRDRDTGDVVVVEGGTLRGIVTDRDIAVRAVADGQGPDTPLSEVLSEHVVCLRPDDRIERAVDLMREHAVRRLPVVEDDQLVGIVSIGDLAMERDSGSALADISAARENS
jgi:CBS domain-containing protein